MKTANQLRPTPGAKVVRLLWSAARQRAKARAARQREIMSRRRPSARNDGASVAQVFTLLAGCLVHVLLGWTVVRLVPHAARADIDPPRGIVVRSADWPMVENLAVCDQRLAAEQRNFAAIRQPRDGDRRRVALAKRARDEAVRRLARATRTANPRQTPPAGESPAIIERQFAARGVDGFVRAKDTLDQQLAAASQTRASIVPILTLVVLGWLAMLLCQGEGLELDVQRRRHPMWEWLLSHPIKPAHAFYSELLVPLMANPVYLAAPLFLWVLLGGVFGASVGLGAAVLTAIPIAMATSALNKALETTALLRLSARSRGAALGVISWIGYVAMVLPFFTLQTDVIGPSAARLGLWLSAWVPAWPIRALLFGWGASASIGQVIVSWWGLAVTLGMGAIWATQRATAAGVESPLTHALPKAAAHGENRFRQDPLRRKELLWLVRDKGAIVQIILIPLTIGGLQAFNLRGLYHLGTGSWTALCGLAVICGTYFLLVLGPRSLASEGGALWLALTWPHGLEDLLKSKARLWNQVATTVVGAVLMAAVIMFPAAWWKIGLVGVGWLLFSSTLSLKAVSLVTAPSSSGEPEPPNRTMHRIALLGTLTFATGVATGNWHVAILGIVFSSLVSVAMWQRLRARLPYLFDVWSEEPVVPPTLFQATVGIAVVVEFTGVCVAIASAAGGPTSLWLARTIAYGLASAVGCVVMQAFLRERGVSLRDIICWSGAATRIRLVVGLAVGAAGGAALSLVAMGYLAALRHIPEAREALDQAAHISATFEHQWVWFFILVVAFAPIAEEYFFRGLLFRTLDRELGDWRALLLSASFFAIFHPPLAWVPVAALGILSAWLFRTTRNLAPSILCHMAYNACLLLLQRWGN